MNILSSDSTDAVNQPAPLPVSPPAGSAWVTLLQKPASRIWRRLLIVLVVSIPLWIYATTWDILVMLLGNASGGKGISFDDIGQRILTRGLLFPLLVGVYFIAVSIPLRRRRTGRFILKQIALALVFSSLARPALVVSYYLANRTFAAAHTLNQVIGYIGPWQIWLATTIQYSIVYLLGLVLIFAIHAFLRFKSEQLKAVQLRSKWLEARLGTLRGQLNPHFFFNALNTVVALIHEDPDRAEKLLTELGTLLRRSLADGHHEFTTVREEVRFVERYLAVMKSRYEDRLSVNLKLDARALDCSIPTFLLVPLVENAIKHGVDKVPGRDTVEISGHHAGEFITFTLMNTAPANSTDAAEPGGGLGLRNTRRRLFAIYGSHYRLESGPGAHGRWVTSVAIPTRARPAVAAADPL